MGCSSSIRLRYDHVRIGRICVILFLGSELATALAVASLSACPLASCSPCFTLPGRTGFTWHAAGGSGKTQPWSPTKPRVCVDTEAADTWQGRPALSPSRPVVSSTQTSSTSSTNVVDSIGMPHRQLRTALLSERLGGGIKTQRALSDVNPPFLQPEFLAQAAELVGLEATSVVTSPEKTAPRLPAKKRKFDWGEKSNGDMSQLSSSSQQQLPSSLIVDKPAQLEPTRRSSVCTMADPSGLTGSSGSMFPYPMGVPVKQRKLSYPNLSFSNPADAFSSLRPPPNVSAYSARNDGGGSSRIRSPPSSSGGGGAVRWKGEFPSPPALPPQRYHPTHHSETGRRFSVFGAPPSLSNALAAQQAAAAAAALRRHSSVVADIPTPPSASSPNANVFNASSTLLQLRQQQQQHIQSINFNDVKPFSRPPPLPSKSVSDENALAAANSYSVAVAAALSSSGVRPLSAPDDQVLPGAGWTSPVKTERPSARSVISPTLPTLPEIPSANTRERQRRMSHVPVLGAILSSSGNGSTPQASSDTPYSQFQSYTTTRNRKHSLDSLFPLPNNTGSNFGGAVLLTGNPGDKSTFELSSGSAGFPLLLVSAPTSASAAELAAATAMASGAPASSLIPVPVQIVPNSTSPANPNSSDDPGVSLVSKTTNEADERLVFPLVPSSDGQIGGCALGFPVLVPSRPRCHSPVTSS
ncbi:unnamed protein product [Hymenolepis diminuta]|uniref:Uncharacterized protein n=1 Tax=Hymenolepis diminuta TaxID=6216 RepID=A0A158QE31_HYMDI|nr:unnamed protein product [Hymenolepis diminuta]